MTSDLFEQTFGPPNGVWDDRYGGASRDGWLLPRGTNLPLPTGMHRLRA